jgi:hypothetical protein
MNGFRRLDYVAYFRRDPRIAAQLDRYQLAADLGDYLVYERIPDAQSRAASPPTVQPQTRDLLQAGPPGGGNGWIRNPVFALVLVVFSVSVVWLTIAEKRRASASAGLGRQGA